MRSVGLFRPRSASRLVAMGEVLICFWSFSASAPASFAPRTLTSVL